MKPTILAVDDTRSNLIALEALLGADYSLLFAHSGMEAVSLTKAHPNLDVILLDVAMPEMDGFETAIEIKKLPGCVDVPIIFISAVHAEEPHVRRGYDVGGIDYLGKPFDADIMRKKLRIYSSFRHREQVLRLREEHLRESEELLRVGKRLSGMLERLNVGVLIVDVDGRICHITDEVSRIFRSSYDEIITWWNREGRLLGNEQGPLWRALQEGKSSRIEPKHLIAGPALDIVMSALPLRGMDGQLAGAVLLIHDVTEPRTIEGDLEGRVARLVELTS